MPERLECEVLQKVRYINTLIFTFTFFSVRKRQAKPNGSVARDWKEIHLNWFIGHLLIVIKTVSVEAI